jgi:hypothetical protein
VIKYSGLVSSLVPTTRISKYRFFFRDRSTKNKKKTISSSRRFSIPRFAPSLCMYDATYRRLGATYLPQENAEEEIVFVGFPSRFSCALAEKEAWVNDVIGRKCTTPTLVKTLWPPVSATSGDISAPFFPRSPLAQLDRRLSLSTPAPECPHVVDSPLRVYGTRHCQKGEVLRPGLTVASSSRPSVVPLSQFVGTTLAIHRAQRWSRDSRERLER